MTNRETSAATHVDCLGLSYNEALECIQTVLNQKLSVLLRGHPGVGKSALAQELAQRMALPLIDIRLAQKDPSEIAGIYFPNHQTNELKLFVPDWVQRASREPVFIFLDEINAGVTKLHQSAAYQLVLDRKLGETQLHPKTVIMGAGNLPEDQSFVTPLAQALCNRFVHFTLGIDSEAWLKWAVANGIDAAIVSYIGAKGEKALYCNDGNVAFPTPRSWSKASHLFRSSPREQRKPLLEACVGQAAASQFFEYERLNQTFDPRDILERGKSIDLTVAPNNEPSFVYAAMSAMADYFRPDQPPKDQVVENLVNFIAHSGIDPEFIIIFLKRVANIPNLILRMKRYKAYRGVATELSTLTLTTSSS